MIWVPPWNMGLTHPVKLSTDTCGARSSTFPEAVTLGEGRVVGHTPTCPLKTMSSTASLGGVTCPGLPAPLTSGQGCPLLPDKGPPSAHAPELSVNFLTKKETKPTAHLAAPSKPRSPLFLNLLRQAGQRHPQGPKVRARTRSCALRTAGRASGQGDGPAGILAALSHSGPRYLSSHPPLPGPLPSPPKT